MECRQFYYDLHPKPRTFFGHIENGKMILSKTGEIAAALWNDIPNHPQFVELGEFVIMPNHIHSILIINKPIW
jgi:REP element-mobilizing transposase RayT